MYRRADLPYCLHPKAHPRSENYDAAYSDYQAEHGLSNTATSTWPSAAAETPPSATAPTPTWPQKSRLRRASDPLVLSSSTAASASLRTAAAVSAASITSASG